MNEAVSTNEFEVSLEFLANYYQRKGVYNTYWYYFNDTLFKKYWRRKDFRAPLARTMLRAKRSKLLKMHGPKLTASTFSAGAKAP